MLSLSCLARSVVRSKNMTVFGYRKFTDNFYRRATLDSESLERSRSVTAFYNQGAIDIAAAKVCISYLIFVTQTICDSCLTSMYVYAVSHRMLGANTPCHWASEFMFG